MSLDDLTLLLALVTVFMGSILGLWIAERFADRLWPKDPDELRIFRKKQQPQHHRVSTRNSYALRRLTTMLRRAVPHALSLK